MLGGSRSTLVARPTAKIDPDGFHGPSSLTQQSPILLGRRPILVAEGNAFRGYAENRATVPAAFSISDRGR